MLRWRWDVGVEVAVMRWEIRRTNADHPDAPDEATSSADSSFMSVAWRLGGSASMIETTDAGAGRWPEAARGDEAPLEWWGGFVVA